MPKPKVKPKVCLLCRAALVATAWPDILQHPPSEACQVRVTNVLGLSIDEDYYVAEEDGQVYARESSVDVAVPMASDIMAPAGPPILALGDSEGGIIAAEEGARLMFEQAGLPYLGGPSGLRGWSSISTFQRCPYLWNATYGSAQASIRREVDPTRPKAPALEVGTLLHLFTAIHYEKMIDAAYPLTPDDSVRFLRAVNVTPAHLDTAWALYEGYRREYADEHEYLTPLAVEHLAADPRDGISCRWDLVFRLDRPRNGQLPGVYVVNTKTASDMGQTTVAQWANDGQILGEIDLYHRLKYDKLWGPLRGACINLVVKTKVPQYNRVWVDPPKAVLRSQRHERRVWSAQLDLAVAQNLFPRARAACVTKWRGLCELFHHCAGADAPREFDS